MLSEKTVSILAGMPYQPDAEWEVNILRFGTFCWKDEIPAIRELFGRPEDMGVIHAMFGMRLKIWDGEALNHRDQELWDAVKRQVPQWALFRRLSLTDKQRLGREKAERLVEQAFEDFGREHDGTSGQLLKHRHYTHNAIQTSWKAPWSGRSMSVIAC